MFMAPITNGKSWILTFTRKPIYPLNASVEHLDIEDIAHALSNQCRFSGHTSHFYSVAQHSVHVAELVADKFKFAALMHDASEAYLQDMPTPIKAMMPQYKEAEANLQVLIEQKFGVSMSDFAKIVVKEADIKMLATEARDLMGDPQDWPTLQDISPLDARIQPWSPQFAKEQFLKRYAEWSK